MSEGIRHLSDYETGQRHRATVVSSEPITPRSAPDEVREIVLDIDREDFSYELGLSAEGPLIFHGEDGYSVKSANSLVPVKA